MIVLHSRSPKHSILNQNIAHPAWLQQNCSESMDSYEFLVMSASVVIAYAIIVSLVSCQSNELPQVEVVLSTISAPDGRSSDAKTNSTAGMLSRIGSELPLASQAN